MQAGESILVLSRPSDPEPSDISHKDRNKVKNPACSPPPPNPPDKTALSTITVAKESFVGLLPLAPRLKDPIPPNPPTISPFNPTDYASIAERGVHTQSPYDIVVRGESRSALPSTRLKPSPSTMNIVTHSSVSKQPPTVTIEGIPAQPPTPPATPPFDTSAHATHIPTPKLHRQTLNVTVKVVYETERALEAILPSEIFTVQRMGTAGDVIECVEVKMLVAMRCVYERPIVTFNGRVLAEGEGLFEVSVLLSSFLRLVCCVDANGDQ